MKHIHTFEKFSGNTNEASTLDHDPKGIEDSVVSGIAEWIGVKNTDLGKAIYQNRNAQSALNTFVKEIKPLLDSMNK
jgi:hypothetical protein